jgi:RHS repeat-associated protein
VNYTYDTNGNQTGRGSDTFAWDYENRLTSAIVSGTQTTYTYNGDGLRQTRASGGVTASYIWDVAAKVPMLLQETTGASTTTYVYGLGLISTTDSSGNQTYYLKDGLGNTVAPCNGSGTVTATYTYDVYGVVRSHTGGTTEFTFTGEQNDPNGLEYLRARYYDNAVGRFLSGDPLGSGYGYAGANPANRVDPTGLYTQCGISDNPEWFGALMCVDSTVLGNPPCDPSVPELAGCYIHTASGDIPLIAQVRDDNVTSCVFQSGDIYLCYVGGTYVGNITHQYFNGTGLCAGQHPAGDFNCNGRLDDGETILLDKVSDVYCDRNSGDTPGCQTGDGNNNLACAASIISFGLSKTPANPWLKGAFFVFSLIAVASSC